MDEDRTYTIFNEQKALVLSLIYIYVIRVLFLSYRIGRNVEHFKISWLKLNLSKL